MKKIEKITFKQKEFLQDLIDFIYLKGYTPTVRELGQYVGLNSPATVKFYLDELEKKGYIERVNNRCIKVLKDANS